jgi:hypothetical protein
MSFKFCDIVRLLDTENVVKTLIITKQSLKYLIFPW